MSLGGHIYSIRWGLPKPQPDLTRPNDVSEAIVSLHGEGTLPFLEAHSQKKKKANDQLPKRFGRHPSDMSAWYLGGDKSGSLGHS